MARYAHLYANAKSDLDAALAKLSKAEHDLALYRRFMIEESYVERFIYWWGRQQGFSDEMMQSLRKAFGADQPADEHKEDLSK